MTFKENLRKIVNRFADKVDSLNWQSISYQRRARELHEQQLNQLYLEEVEAMIDRVLEKGHGGGNFRRLLETERQAAKQRFWR